MSQLNSFLAAGASVREQLRLLKRLVASPARVANPANVAMIESAKMPLASPSLAMLLVLNFTLVGCGKLATDLSKALENSSTNSKLQVYTSGAIALNTCTSALLVASDSNGSAVPQEQPLEVDLNVAGTGGIYTDAACTTPVTKVTIAAKKSSATFYLKSTGTGTFVLSASADGMNSAVQPISVASTGTTGQPSKMNMYVSSTITAGTCAPVMLVTTDAAGSVLSQTSALPVTLTLSGSATTYSDSACSTAASSVSIPISQSSATFYLKSSTAGSVILNALAASYAPSVQPISIAAATQSTQPAKIQLSGATSIYSGSCVNYLVSALDANGLNTALTLALPITVNGLGNGQFYSDASCTTTLSSLSLLSGTSYRSVYYKTPSNETNVFFLQASGYQSASMTVNSSTPSVSVPQKLLLTGSVSSTVNLCAGPYTVKILDQNLIQVNVGSNVTVNMSSASGNLNYFSDSACATALPSSALTVTSGTSQTNFYVKTTIAGDQRIQAEDPSFSLSATQLDLSMKAGAANKLELSSVSSILVDSCQSTFVFLKDAQNNILTNTAPVNVTLSDSGSGAFYTDASCTQQTLSLLLPTGLAQLQFYYKNSVPETSTATASRSGLTSGTQIFTASQSPSQLPSKLLLAGNNSVTAGNCSSAYTVTVKDVNNMSRSFSTVPTTVNLLPASTFFSDNGCTLAISNLSFGSGQSSKSVYIKKATSGNITLTAQTAGLSDGTQAVQVLGGAADRVKITGSTNISVGQCAVYDVAVQDPLTNLTAAPGSLSISLSSSNSGAFYTASDCLTGATTSITISVGGVNQSFYYKPALSGSHVLTAAPTMGLTNSTLTVASSSNPVTKLTVTSVSSGSAGSCQLATLTSRDSGNFVTNVGADTTVNLSATGSAAMFSNAGCTVAAPTVTISNGTSTASFYYKNTAAESVTVTAASSGLTSATFNYSTSAAAPTKIRAQGASPILAGACSAITVDVLDTNNNPSAVTSGTVINFAGLGATAKVYSDSGCVTQISSLTMLSGESTKFIYLKNPTAESLSVAFDDPGPLTLSTLAISTNPLAASKYVMSAAANTTYGACLPVTITTQDQFGNLNYVTANTTVTMAGNGTGAFYTSSGCSTTPAPVQFTTSVSTQTIYFKTPDVGTYTLTATGGTLTDAGASVNVQAGAANKLVVLGSASISTNACTIYTAQIRDSGNVTTTAASNTAVNLTGAGGGAFYSDSSCLASITGLTITAGSAQANFYYKNATAQTATLNADDTGSLTAGTLAVTTTSSGGGAGGATKLLIAGTTDATLNTCSPYSIVSQDATNNPANVGSLTTVNLSGSGTGLFYSDSICTTPATSVDIASGTNNKQFYFKTSSPGSFLFMGIATGLNFAMQSVNVAAPAGSGGGSGGSYVPIKLLISGPTDVLSSSCAGQFTVSSADSTGLLTPVQATEVVTLTNGAGNGIFYSDSACSTTITSLTFGPGQSQKTFYFKDAQAESVSLQAYSANLIYGSLSVQVKPSGRLNLSLSNASSIWQNFIYRGKGTLSDRTIVLQNVGLTQANAVTLNTPSISGTFGFRGSTYPGLGGTCADNSVLLPNQQCTMIVRFQPTSVASFSDNVRVNYTVGAASLQVNLPLSGTANTNLNPMAVNAGAEHTCVTLSDMSTKCFGLNDKGQLGVGNTTNYGVANKDIESLSWTPYGHFATQVVAGAQHTCGLMPDGSVTCWGDNTYGQLGTGGTVNIGFQSADLAAATYTKVDFGSGNSATKLSSGAYHTCALLQNGSVKCWGRNDNGQLGLGDATNRGRAGTDMGTNLTALDFGVGQTVVDIAGGANHTCVILKGGQLKCWGRNIFGQLGIGSTADMGDNSGEMGTGLSPVSLGSGATVLSVGAGTDHTCAILTVPSQGDPIVKCWGRNDYGQLGIGDALQRGTSPSQMGDALPIVDLGLSGVPKKMALGRVHSCVLLATGSVKCWGSNQFGQTGLSESVSSHRGDGSAEMGNSLPTVTLGASVLATDLSSGMDHTCALIDTNKVRCWGRNDKGQLGHNHSSTNVASWGHSTSTMASLPDSWVNNYSYYEGIALDSQYTCGVSRSQNEVICWGNTAQSGVSYPTKYHDFSSKGGVKQLEAGTGFMCALTNDASNSVYCWGDNGWYTDNGTATTTTYTVPNLGSPTMTGVSQIATGEGFMCALTTTNTIKCFGQSIAGSLGTATAFSFVAPGAAVTMTIPSGTPASIYAGASHACAINTSGAVSCWGANNYGQVGDGTVVNKTAPTAITLAATASKLSLGRHHSCAVLTTGVVQCWGDNQYGQLGLGSATTSFNTPQTLSSGNLGGTGLAKDLSLGEDSSCAIMSDDKFRCWGRNSVGELAIGTTANQNTGQAANLGEDFRIFMAKAPKRGQHRCAIGWENARQVPFQLKCWGDNSAGQLGYNDTTNRGGTSALVGRALLPVPQNATAAITAFGSTPLLFSRSSTINPSAGTTSNSIVLSTPTANSSPVVLSAGQTFGIGRTFGTTGLRFKLWGGGGGAGKGNCGPMGGNGGAGGSVFADVPNSLLTGPIQIWVAGGGQVTNGQSTGNTGSGGGSSAISINGTIVLLAAGGGGGGGTYSGSAGNGGPSETAGTVNANGGNYAGNPGTTSGPGSQPGSDWTGSTGPGLAFASGGTGGCHVGLGCSTPGGIGWSSGGAGVTTRAGGGGGGGYNGGSAGGTWSSQAGSGGGGGSNFMHASITVASKALGSGTSPGNTADTDYGGSAGVGGAGSNGCSDSTTFNGANGRVVIIPY